MNASFHMTFFFFEFLFFFPLNNSEDIGIRCGCAILSVWSLIGKNNNNNRKGICIYYSYANWELSEKWHQKVFIPTDILFIKANSLNQIQNTIEKKRVDILWFFACEAAESLEPNHTFENSFVHLPTCWLQISLRQEWWAYYGNGDEYRFCIKHRFNLFN